MFLQAKKDAAAAPIELRPFIASEIDDLPQCERWRSQVIREISKEVSLIQNGSLGEHKIRDMNDKINKLLREKRHWERQIRKLGGPDYEKLAPKTVDVDGKRAMGNEGYFYFGAAKDLPGVRELFEKLVPETLKRTRGDLHKLIDADYYGYKDEDDGLLVKLEAQQEKKAVAAEMKQWKERQSQAKKQRIDEDDDAEVEDEGSDGKAVGSEDVYKAHVPLPSQEEIEKALLDRKKKELLAKYATKA